MTPEEMLALLVRIAEMEAHEHGPDGNAYGFTGTDYPEGPAGFGDTKEEAAVEFLKELYGQA